jgi:hypothetical protein
MEIVRPKKLHIHSLPILLIGILLIVAFATLAIKQSTSVNGNSLLQSLINPSYDGGKLQTNNPYVGIKFQSSGQEVKELLSK